ncbi:metal-dependent hydrolase [Floricoccus tropicus]|uniref:Metal-dependent hydrolase n=1 Tax=Floricoccus tropicus TaxID=1859473 RepID=A0A1E8GKH9_9LACT|nr:MBL fold metallo-hydrolase [Floricoccus tropicus]OFI48697.1 metal-dependent hydrolase [Floricoccus tropicus]
MKLTTLGCWGGYPYKDAGTTSFLLTSESGFNLLIDAGSRAVTELEHELSPLQLDAVIISHYHQDHIADLGVLQQYRQLWPKTDPEWDSMILDIYGHNRDEVNFKNLTLANVSNGHAYDYENGQKIGPFDITFIETVHPVVCYAMRIVERKTGQTLVFTGDTGWFDDLIPFTKGADMFLADVYLFKGQEKHFAHLTSFEAGKIAREAGVKKLVLTHLPQHAPTHISSENYLEILRDEAQTEAGAIPVELAEPHRKWDFNDF